MITAFVSEYFGGRQNGLGNRITSNMTANTAAAWAYVLGACLLGLAFYLVSIVLGEHHHNQRGAQPRGRNHVRIHSRHQGRGGRGPHPAFAVAVRRR